jgi:alpha-mannosidase
LELAVQRVRDLFSKMRVQSNGDIYLLNNGCDHFPPQRSFGRILRALREAFPQTEFLHTGFQDYVDAIKQTGQAQKRHAGELVSGRYNHILSGVWSARMYLKQLNDQAQTLLESYLEPIAAYAHFHLGQAYPLEQIRYAWKLLLKNHPHDSICGCSVDEVHREMVPRFEGVVQTGEQLLGNLLEAMAPMWARQHPDDRHPVLTVVNPLPQARTAVIERLVVLMPGAHADRLALYDQQGKRIPFETVACQHVERFWNVDYRGQLFSDRQANQFRMYCDHFGDRLIKDPGKQEKGDLFVALQFIAEDLPALGHASYYVREDGTPGSVLPLQPKVAVTGDTLENEYYRLQLHPNGTFDLFEKGSGTWLKGLNRLEDTEDVGDEYDYSASDHSQTVYADDAAGAVREVLASPLIGRLASEYELHLPREIERNRRERSPQRVACSVRTEVCLKAGSRIVEVETVFDNCARDHRLRTEFPTGIKADSIVSDGHFYINRRPIDQPKGENWVQPPTGTYPQQEFSLIQGEERGLAVLVRGLPEVATFRDGNGDAVLSLTLLRSVGWLSRDDFGSRQRSNAGPTLFTPDAQCLGPQRFQYALVPFRGHHLAADIKGLSRQYRTPVIVRQGVADGHLPGGTGLLQKESPRTSISAIKKHETRDTLLVRLFNLTADEVAETLTCGMKIDAAWHTNLLEDRGEELAVEKGRQVPLRLGPHQIVTVELALTPARP